MNASPPEEARNPAATRSRILDAALRAFSTSGFDGSSARHIERVAGVERGLVAYHFGTKERLWETTVDQVYARWRDELFALQDALRDVSRGERARAMLMAYARFSLQSPEFFRILVLEGHVKSARSAFLALRLWEGVRIFRDVTDQDGPRTPAEAIGIFQILGAAGSMSAMTAYLDDDLTEALGTPDIIETFARSLATFSVSQLQQPGIA